MEIAVIVILVVITVALFLRSRGGPTAPAKKAGKSKTRKSAGSTEPAAAAPKSFAAVSLAPGPDACEAVLSFGESRFLSGDAPILPLADCGSTTCSCKYVHYEDRRDHSEERRQPFSLRTDLHGSAGEDEKRQRAGRRGSDKV